LGLDGGELVVGVVGRLHHKKNCELALRGFAEFARTASAAIKPRLLFMGDGDQRESLAELASSLAVNVSFSGFVPDAARYLPALDLLLFPASRAEAFGMVALEAMLAEVPVVCSRAPGPAWVLGEGASYFDNDEPLEVAGALHRGFDTKPTARARALEVFSPRGLAERLEAIAQ
jgi:glycosyltransferase involved in cell wall biosynthesis